MSPDPNVSSWENLKQISDDLGPISFDGRTLWTSDSLGTLFKLHQE